MMGEVRAPGRFASKSVLALVVAAALIVALAGAGWWRASQRDSPCPVHFVDVRWTSQEHQDAFVLDQRLAIVRPITDDGQAGSASMSPDGDRVAVSTTRDDPVDPFGGGGGEESRVYLYPADAEAPATPLTDGPHDGSPDWSPDGERVVYAAGDEARGSRQIKLVDPDNGSTSMVYEAPEGGGVSGPQWSPDGARIAFMKEHGTRGTIWTVEPDGGELTDLGIEGDAEDFDWSPDGRHLVVDTRLNEELERGYQSEELDDGLGAGLRKVEVATGETTVFAGTAETMLLAWMPEGLLVRPDPRRDRRDDVPRDVLYVVDPQRGTRQTIEFEDDYPNNVDLTPSC